MEVESVIIEQRQRIGSELVERRITQDQRWLRTTRRLLLPEYVGDVVSAKGTSRRGFFDGMGNRLGAILADEFE